MVPTGVWLWLGCSPLRLGLRAGLTRACSSDARPKRSPIEGGTCYYVSTPIGNLEDITVRALRTLKEADYVASEDTRVTATLLRALDVKQRGQLVEQPARLAVGGGCAGDRGQVRLGDLLVERLERQLVGEPACASSRHTQHLHLLHLTPHIEARWTQTTDGR